jgi:hypothetical protein
LDNLVAPVALYPDPLLSQVLVASTYPLELVEAEQWMQANGSLHGQDLMNAAKQQPWDASVQAMVAFPDVLARLNQDVRWTTDLGNAFLAQQADVMQAVQQMRAQAQANGKLQTTPQQVVTDQTQGGQTAVTIEPANPQVIYVPTYDPMYVWGPPAWGYYPGLYYPAFGFFGRYGFHSAYGFAGRGVWAHDPMHRLGVPYSNAALNNRFGAISHQSAMSAGVRGFNGQRFGGSNFANRSAAPGGFNGGRQFGGAQNFRSAPAQNFRGSQYASRPSSGGAQSFAGGGQRFGAGQQQRFAAPQQHFSAPQAQHFNAPQAQHFSAPQQHFSAPQQHFSGGGGGGHAFSGGGGGGGHFGGGGHHR